MSDVEIAGPPAVIKEKHLKVHLKQNGRGITAKAWNFADRLSELQPGARLDAALRLEEDSFAASQGWPGWSLVLKDVRPATVASHAAASVL